MRRFTGLLLALGLGMFILPAKAMMVFISDGELVATSDLIVVGTVTDDSRLPDVPDWTAGQAVIHVDRVIKGSQSLTNANITVRHAVVPITPPGMVIMDHGGIALKPQQQQLFFLQHAQGGYSITGGQQGMKAVGDADRYTMLAKEIPETVELIAPIGPFYFDQPTQVTLKIRNDGKMPVHYLNPNLEGYFFASRMDTFINFRPVVNAAPLVVDTSKQTDSTIIAPGAQATVTLKLSSPRPASWQLFTPDTYLLTPVNVRARIFIQPEIDPASTSRAQGYNITSSWVRTLAGFPPPQQDAQ